MHTNVENVTAIGEGWKDKLLLGGQRRFVWEKDELHDFRSFPSLLQYSFSFILYIKLVKVNERNWMKTLFFFLLRLFLTREERTALMMGFNSTPFPSNSAHAL